MVIADGQGFFPPSKFFVALDPKASCMRWHQLTYAWFKGPGQGSLTADTAQQMEPTFTGEHIPFIVPSWSPGPTRVETLQLDPQGHTNSTTCNYFLK